jgi:hypothetical protein
LGELDGDEFDLLLSLVGDAIAGLGDAEEASVPSSDGGVIVRIEQAERGRRATLHTGAGILRGPDHKIEVLRVGRTG